jgi:hypothetical protein
LPRTLRVLAMTDRWGEVAGLLRSGGKSGKSGRAAARQLKK